MSIYDKIDAKVAEAVAAIRAEVAAELAKLRADVRELTDALEGLRSTEADKPAPAPAKATSRARS